MIDCLCSDCFQNSTNEVLVARANGLKPVNSNKCWHSKLMKLAPNNKTFINFSIGCYSAAMEEVLKLNSVAYKLTIK